MIKKNAYAKLDLGIEIKPSKASDGYYPVEYIDCQLELHDTLTFELKNQGIELICSDKSLPTDEKNFVFRAAELLRSEVGNPSLGAKITLIKNIPVKAGFGGGSSDAAAAVAGFCELWDIKVTDGMIVNLSKDLGKDFYYSYYGGLCEVSGTGKNYQLTKLPFKLPKFWVVIVVPNEQKPSTGWVYSNLNFKTQKNDTGKLANLKKYVGESDKMSILKNLSNDFEKSVTGHYPIVKEIRKDLSQAGAGKSIMAGAGLSVVGFFESREEAEAGKKQLRGKYKQVLVSAIKD